MTDSAKRQPNKTIHYRAQLRAALWAIAILLAGGLAYRALERGLHAHSEVAPPPVGALAKLPFEIGNWRGRDVPLDERVATATDTDDHLSRVYKSRRRTVGLYVAFGTQFRDLLPHRPEVCYPAAGWVLQKTRSEVLITDVGRRLPIRIHQFQGGPVDASMVTVLSYHVLDGEVVADIDELRHRGGGLSRRIRYVAQVQIRASSGFDVDRATKCVRAFAAESAAPILLIMTNTPADPVPGTEPDG